MNGVSLSPKSKDSLKQSNQFLKQEFMRDNQYYLRNLYGQRDLENYYLSMNIKKNESAGVSKKALNLSELIKRNLERQRKLPINSIGVHRQKIRELNQNIVHSDSNHKFKSVYMVRPQTGQVNFNKRSFVIPNYQTTNQDRITHSSDQKHRLPIEDTRASNNGTLP